MNSRERELCRAGSIAAAARKIGEEAALEAMRTLTMAAPEEVQGSWPLVISYSRLQIAYEDSMNMGDTKTAMQASEMQSKMIRDLY